MKSLVLGALTAASVLLPARNDVRVSTVDAARSLPAVRTCQNVQLLIQAQSSQGAAGHIGVIYRLHNLSGRSCTLDGYPGVQLLSRRFVSLPTAVTRGPGGLVGAIPKQPVTLAAHGNAYFALGYSDVPVRNQPCEQASYLMIFAPDNFLPVVTYAFTGGGSIVACGGAVNVSPVTSRPRFQ